MARVETLDKDRHRRVRVRTTIGPRLGWDQALAPLGPREFQAASIAFPIAFRRVEADEAFEPVALLGLGEGENLFLSEGRWNAPYAPLDLRRGPLLLVPGAEPGKLALSIDLEHPRVSETEGERLFFNQGLRTDFLEGLRALVLEAFEGRMQGRALGARLAALDLLEPLRLEAELEDGARVALTGLYGVSRERLYALSSDQAGTLFKEGVLELALLHLASLGLVATLATLKSEQVKTLRGDAA